MASSHGGGSSSTAVVELIVVLILVFFGLWYLKNPSTDNVTTGTGQTVTDNSKTAVPIKNINYTQALALYKNARIQLDKTCQAKPSAMTFKNNSYLMIDNRAPVDRTVRAGSVFNVKAYGFQIVKLSSEALPATWYVDCDSSQNVATILIQK